MICPVEEFSSEHNVIIYSNYDARSMDWDDYMRKNWDRLIRRRSSVLVLAGIHGNEDGSLGRVDPELVLDYQEKVKGIQEDYAADLAEREAAVDVLDLAGYVVERTVDGVLERDVNAARLTEDVERRKPTVIVIAFCWTRRSVLNRIFRAAGMYAFLVLNDDRARITEGRCLTMDDAQRKVIEDVVRDNPKNVFLWGGSGTGKTLLLTQALNIKKSYYELKLRKTVRVVVCIFWQKSDELMEEMKRSHFAHIDAKEVRFCFLRQPHTGYEDPKTTLKNFVAELSREDRESGIGSVHTLLLVDEVEPVTQGKRMDWSDLDLLEEGGGREDVDVLVALSPHSWEFKHTTTGKSVIQLEQLSPPTETTTTLARRLRTCHRNSRNIQNLNLFVKSHILAEEWAARDPELDPFGRIAGRVHRPPDREAPPEDVPEEEDDDKLPSGPPPVWILRGEEVTELEVLEAVEERFVGAGESGTIISDSRAAGEPIRRWCRERRNWKCYLHQSLRPITGCEDQVVVLFTWEWTRHLNLVELLTRARNRLLVVTARFHHYMPGRYDDLVMVLEAAHDHGAGRSCYECPTLGEGCRFAGVQLLQRVMLGDERPWHSKHKIVNRLRRLCRGPLELGCAAADRSFMVSLCCVEKVMERTSLYIQAEEEEENRGEGGTSGDLDVHLVWLATVLCGVWGGYGSRSKDWTHGRGLRSANQGENDYDRAVRRVVEEEGLEHLP